MSENQNPVFTDNVSVSGDGTVENPLTSRQTSFGSFFADLEPSVSSNIVAMDGSEDILIQLDMPIPDGKEFGVFVLGQTQFNNADGDADDLIIRIRQGTDLTGTLIATVTLSVLATQANAPVLLNVDDANNSPQAAGTRSYILTAEWASAGGATITFSQLIGMLLLNF